MKRVIALGFFDGVHIGHAALLKTARQRADALSCPACVLTFDRHPGTVISGRRIPLINSREDREYLLRTVFSMDEVIFAHFDRAMMEMPWQEFLEDALFSNLEVCHVVCGEDFTFGYHGCGNAGLLSDFCAARGVSCDVIPEVLSGGCPVHSTLIRKLLAKGELERANALLGHPHCISGKVITGKRFGRTMGVPTANIAIPPSVLVPAHGVYCTAVSLGDAVYPAVTNVGCRPTVDDTGLVTVEPWILDFSGDLYGKELRVFFYKRLRGEIKFPSTEALKAEILKNAAETRAYFETHPF